MLLIDFQDGEVKRQSNFHTKNFLESVSNIETMMKTLHSSLEEHSRLVCYQISQQRELVEKYTKEQESRLEEQRTLMTKFVTTQMERLEEHSTHTQNTLDAQQAFSKVGVKKSTA